MASTRARAVAALFILLPFTTAIESISDSEDSFDYDEQVSDDLNGNNGTEQSEVISLNNCTDCSITKRDDETV